MQTTQTKHRSEISSDITHEATESQMGGCLALISAYFDGEFEPSDTEPSSTTLPLAADLDPLDYKEDWALYALISDSLAQPANRAFSPSVEFSARLSAALQREPAHQCKENAAPDHAVTTLAQTAPKRSSVWSRWFSWPSLAVASAIVAVVWVSQPLLMLDTVVVVATPAPVVEPSAAVQAVSDYANAHRHFSGPIAVRQASFEPELER